MCLSGGLTDSSNSEETQWDYTSLGKSPDPPEIFARHLSYFTYFIAIATWAQRGSKKCLDGLNQDNSDKISHHNILFYPAISRA